MIIVKIGYDLCCFIPRSDWFLFPALRTQCRVISRNVKCITFPVHDSCFNPLIATLKPNHHIAIQWLVHWPLMGGMLHLVQRGGDWAGLQPAQSPPRCTKCNSPPINGQCTLPTSYYSMYCYVSKYRNIVCACRRGWLCSWSPGDTDTWHDHLSTRLTAPQDYSPDEIFQQQ